MTRVTGERLLLVGAGHTHLHVLTRGAQLRDAGYDVRLLAPGTFRYSGVASATAAGSLPADAGTVDVAALARAYGVPHVEATLVDLDLGARTANTSTGLVLDYDVVSLNLGSVVASHGIRVDPDVVRVKPLADLARLSDWLGDRLGDRMGDRMGDRLGAGPGAGPGAVVTVVGGGATGLELAAHLSTRADVSRVRVLEAGPCLGPDLPPGARRRLLRLLRQRGVDTLVDRGVAELGARQVTCVDGSVLEHDVALLATGLVAPPLVAELGLGTDAGVPVRATLQHVTHDEVYAVGDCADFTPRSLPRIGVHGVRQGPLLVRSLVSRRSHADLPAYEPQRLALAVLDLGGGVGLAVRGRWWLQGRAALRLKRWLDRRWLRRYETP